MTEETTPTPGTWPDPRDAQGRHYCTPSELIRMNAAERAGHPLLTWRGVTGGLEILELDPKVRYSIGRRSEASIPLTWDSHASALHAEITSVCGEWILTDAGLSKNGTYVDERRVDVRVRLHDDGRIRAGRSLIAFHLGAASRRRCATAAGGQDVTARFDDVDRAILRELCRHWVCDNLPTIVCNRDIARSLGYSADNIDKRLGRMYSRAGVATLRDGEKRVALAAYATRNGVVTRRDYRSEQATDHRSVCGS